MHIRAASLRSVLPYGRIHGTLSAKRAFSISKRVKLAQSLNKQRSDTGDDELIRKIFDSKTFWEEFNNPFTDETLQSGSQVSSKDRGILNSLISQKRKSVGLFCNPYLVSPKGLVKFAEETLVSARALTDNMIEDQSEEGLRRYIKDLDRLSDMLCRVIDLCEFVRVAHPDSSFVNAAEKCHYELFEHMNILNTSKPLFDKLEKVLFSNTNIKKSLTKEEISVGKLLYADFKKSGIDMDDATGEQFVQLSSYIANAGQEFNNNITVPKSTTIKIEADEWSKDDIKPEYLKMLSQGFDGSLKIPIYGHIPFELLRSTPNRTIRRKIWMELHNSPDEQIDLLTNLLRCREVLANVMNCKSYSEYALNDKMAHNPENVIGFLQNLIQDLQPQVLDELKLLYKYLPEADKSDPANDEQIANSIKPWDREYLLTKHILAQKSSQNEDISQYFSLGTVVSGLSNLFNSIYGIRLVPQKLQPGEVWSSDVRRFDAISDKEGKVGIMYLDLFQRRGKTPHPAHFTVCCSRRLSDNELDANDPFKLKTFPTQETVETITQGRKTYQLPVISLVCNYNESQNKAGMICLTLDQISTLFHEMGHAMHSMLGRTELHNVSGTRCQTDFVELPSILHETFANDERVLAKIGRHYETGEPLPLPLIKKHLHSDKTLKYCESLGQVKMALLDQIFHGASGGKVNDESFDALSIYHELEKNLVILADTKSSWPGKFGHLYSYGALYYSYLLDRAIASKMWEKLFKEDPFSREAGEKFKNEVLKWGGSRDPWVCLSKVFENKELAKGDVNAMKLICEDNKL